jgi:peroxiredoxin
MTPEIAAAPPPPPTPRLGFAIAALVTGLAAMGLSLVIVGGLLGVVGIVLALIHLVRRPDQPKKMAMGGLALSILSIVASMAFAMAYYTAAMNIVASMRKAASFPEWVGVQSPDFTVTTMDGQTLKLSELKGKRVVVDHWATWCGPCIMEIPHFNQLRRDVAADDLVVVGLSYEKESIVTPFLANHDLKYPVAAAQKLPSPYSRVSAFPTTFFIDRAGVIQSVLVGYHDFDTLKEHSTASDYQGEMKATPGKL